MNIISPEVKKKQNINRKLYGMTGFVTKDNYLLDKLYIKNKLLNTKN